MEVDEGSDQKKMRHLAPLAAHAYLTNEFTEDKKCQKFMSWILFYIFRSSYHVVSDASGGRSKSICTGVLTTSLTKTGFRQ